MRTLRLFRFVLSLSVLQIPPGRFLISLVFNVCFYVSDCFEFGIVRLSVSCVWWTLIFPISEFATPIFPSFVSLCLDVMTFWLLDVW